MPVPLPLLLVWIHVNVLVADQAHPLGVVTVKLPDSAPALWVQLDGLKLKVQVTPDWVMVNVCPPARIVPCRELELVLASIL